MSKKKTKTSSTSSGTATTTPNVPDWISTPMQGIAGQINNLVGQAPVVTPMSALQRQAFSTAGGLLSGNSNIGDAQSATRGLLDYTPGNVDAGQLSTTDLNPYMNPYQQQVIDSLIGDFGHANDVGLNSLRSMTPNGAYGGSRQMVAAGQMVGDNARTLAGTVASLRNQGYQNAQQAALTDIGNRLSADQFNVNSGLAGANLRLGAANQLGQQGLASDANNRANLGLMADLGAQERGIADESNPTTYLARLLALLQGTNPGLFTGQTVNQSGQQSGQSTETGMSFGFDWGPFHVGGAKS